MKKNVAERRTEILAATVAVIAERGFGHTRIADVAARLGTSTGLLHYHFESKDLLLAAAFEHAAQRDLIRLSQAIGADGDPLERLVAVLDLYLPAVEGSSWPIWIDAWGEALHNPALRSTSQRLDAAWKQGLADVIEQAGGHGSLHCADPAGAARRLGALVDGLGVDLTLNGGDDDEVMIQRQARARNWLLTAAEVELHLAPGRLTQVPGSARRDQMEQRPTVHPNDIGRGSNGDALHIGNASGEE
ncbi:MAG: TetR family transcriptional regulator C-terminal domain-containing protein [Ilumatobacteraceae bacterium]